MSFSGGVFSINTAGQPVVAGTSISATVFNAFTADIATGLSTCMLKDGTQTATAGIGFFAGTVSLPGIYFGTETGTGFYRIGANNTGFAINGTKLLDLSSASVALTGAMTISTTLGVTGTTTLGAVNCGSLVSSGNVSTPTGALSAGDAISGSTFLNAHASITSSSSIRLQHGVAPTSPVNGDMWTTTAGLFVQINGSTKTVTLT